MKKCLESLIMPFINPMVVCTALFLILGCIFFIIAFFGLKKKKFFTAAFNFLAVLLMLALSALCAVLSISMRGYRALIKEEVAAVVQIDPLGEQRFRARFSMPNGSDKQFFLSGDELYVDAHILKWKPLANFFGLHTSYELDRVAGRYTTLQDETNKPHTVFSLAKGKFLNIFKLRRIFAELTPLLDAEYGSATYVNAKDTEVLKIMVSTTGLLIRKSDSIPDRKKGGTMVME
jgi:hypothetical protein